MTDDRDFLAAEFALGLLEGDERAQTLRRVIREPDFAREVERWRTEFADLYDVWPEVDAGPEMAGRIAQIGGAVADVPVPANDTAPARRASPWAKIAAVGSLIAACLLLAVLLRPAPEPVVIAQRIPVAVDRVPATLLVATLKNDAKLVPAVFDPGSGTFRVAAPPSVSSTKVAELWVIGEDGVPFALGLLEQQNQRLTLTTEARAKLAPGATLAISIEPTGGSTTGAPTGPVVATGVLSTV